MSCMTFTAFAAFTHDRCYTRRVAGGVFNAVLAFGINIGFLSARPFDGGTKWAIYVKTPNFQVRMVHRNLWLFHMFSNN